MSTRFLESETSSDCLGSRALEMVSASAMRSSAGEHVSERTCDYIQAEMSVGSTPMRVLFPRFCQNTHVSSLVALHQKTSNTAYLRQKFLPGGDISQITQDCM